MTLTGATKMDVPAAEFGDADDAAGTRSNYNAVVAAMLGTAAGTVGVVSPVGSLLGLRPWHVLCFLALGLALYAGDPVRILAMRITSIDVVAVLFVGWCVAAEVIDSSELGYSAGIPGALAPLYFLPGYWAARVMMTGGADLAQFLEWFSFPALILGPIAGLQVGWPSFSEFVLKIAPGPGLEARILDGRLIRATGLVGHWTGSGFLFCCLLAAACSALILNKKLGRQSGLLTVTVVMAAVGSVASLTLTAIICAVLIVVVFLKVYGASAGAIVVTGLVAIALYWQFGSYLGERIDQQTAYRPSYVPDWLPNTLAYRWRIWSEQTVPVIQERLMTGWGADLYSGRQRPSLLVWHSPESQWFGVLVMYGLIGFLALIFVAVRSLWVAGMMSFRPGGSHWLPILILFIGAAVGSVTVSVYTSRGYPVAFWVLLGLLLGVLTSREKEPKLRRGEAGVRRL